jgi:hypothetical protein
MAWRLKRWRDGRWRCAGAPPGWSGPARSSAGSTATYTYASLRYTLEKVTDTVGVTGHDEAINAA